MVITFNVAFGGMKGITFVQAFQYWAKLFAISAPIFVLTVVFGGYSEKLALDSFEPDNRPRIKPGSMIKVKGARDYPAKVLTCWPGHVTGLEFPEGAVIERVSPVRKPEPGEVPVSELLVI